MSPLVPLAAVVPLVRSTVAQVDAFPSGAVAVDIAWFRALAGSRLGAGVQVNQSSHVESRGELAH